MSSAAPRQPHERRQSAHPDDKARSRTSAHSSFRSDRQESQPHSQQQQQSTSHKRSASGNPRPVSRSMDDRRTEERRTERTYVTQRETLATRTRSPERQERHEKKESRHRPAESRAREARESKSEPPPGG